MKVFYFIIFFFLLPAANTYSQNLLVDTAIKKNPSPSKKSQPDSTTKKTKTYSPALAATRSAIIPGWGQIYNKKYWKVPIIWGSLGATVYVFRNNIKFYKEYKFAYAARIEAQTPPLYDSTNYNQL